MVFLEWIQQKGMTPRIRHAFFGVIMHKKYLAVVFLSAQLLTVSALAASAPTRPVSRVSKETHHHKEHTKYAKKSKSTLIPAYAWQTGLHFFVKAGVDQVYDNAPRLISVQMETLNNNYIVNQKPGWRPRFTGTVGFHFSNSGFLSGMMGHQNSVTASFSYMSANLHAGNPDYSDGSVGNLNFYVLSGASAARGNEHSALLSYAMSARYIQREINVDWNGFNAFGNGRFSVMPSFGLVYNWQTNNQSSSVLYQPVAVTPAIINDKTTIDQTIRYYGVSFGEQFNYAINHHWSISLHAKIEALHATARFNAVENFDIVRPPLPYYDSISTSITDREILGLSVRFAFLDRPNSPYIVVRGGVEHWGWVPQFQKLANNRQTLQLRSISVWDPYYGIELVIPFAT